MSEKKKVAVDQYSEDPDSQPLGRGAFGPYIEEKDLTTA